MMRGGGDYSILINSERLKANLFMLKLSLYPYYELPLYLKRSSLNLTAV